MTQEIIKYVLIVFAVGSIFFACNSSDSSKSSTEVTTDSSSYKIDSATSAVQKALDTNSVQASATKQKVADGPGVGGGYVADQKKDKKVSDGPGAGGGYIADQKKDKKVSDGPGNGGGYIAGQKDGAVKK